MYPFKKIVASGLLFILLPISPSFAAPFDDWTQAGTTGSWKSIACSTNCESAVAVQSPDEIWVSNDMGSTWVARTSGTSRSWTGVAMSGDGQIIYAAASNNYLYKSTDNGLNWSTLTSAGTAFWTDVATSSDGSVIIASVSGGSVRSSTDYGANWVVQSAIGTTSGWTAVDITGDASVAIASVNTGQLWRGSGTPGSWTWVNITTGKMSTDGLGNLATQNWKDITIDSTGARIAGVSNELYISTDTGSTWKKITAGNFSFSGIAASGDLKLVMTVNSANCMPCRPIKATTSDYSTYTYVYAANAPYPGYSSIAVASDGSRAIAATTSSYIYRSGTVAITSSTSLTSPSNPIFRTPSTITANLSPSTGGRVTFYANGKKIGNCISLVATTSTVDCTWKPSVKGSVRLSAKFVPTDPLASTVTSQLVNTTVRARASIR